MSSDVQALLQEVSWPPDQTQGREAGELLLRVAYETEQMLTEASSAEGLSAREARALRYVQEAQPQHELAARLGVDPARVTGLLKTLEQRGLVQRDAWVDKRVRIVSLTPDGIAAIDRIGKRIAEKSRFVSALTSDERQALLATLRKLARPAG